ncbi:MAG: competence protein ComEA [Frankiales bacterium]|nr:competence protein ComEA [Frankiales bacterium]
MSTIRAITPLPSSVRPTFDRVQRGAEGRDIGGQLAALLARLSTPDRLAETKSPDCSATPGAALRRSLRCNPGRGGAIALALVAVISVLGAAAWVAMSQPHRIPVASAGTPASSAASSIAPGGSLRSPVAGSSASPTVTVVVVDVVGLVRRPGVYRLPSGSRVDDAVHAAGGVRAGVDLTGLNLARKLSDGEQVAVGVTGAGASRPEAGSGSGSGGSGGGPASGLGSGVGTSAGVLDLNSATLSQLDGLPGVGPVLAQRILDWRTAHGRFDAVDQLRSVTGIGDAKFADLKSVVTVS